MGLLPKNREHGWAPYVWLIFMAFFFFQPVLDPHATTTEWIITVTASLAFLPIYFGVFWTKPPFTYLLLLLMVAMGVGFANYNVGSSVFIIFAASFIPWVAGTSRRSMAALTLLVLIIAVDAAIFHTQVGFWATSIVVALGVA